MSKLPLTIRKEVRDSEPKKTEILAKLEKHAGVKVTYDFPMETAYEALDTHRYRDGIVGTSLEYLNSLSDNFAKAFGDAMVKQAFLAAWTTKNIAMVVLSDADYAKARTEKNMVESCDSYNGLRLGANGDLQIVAPFGNFACNTHNVYGHNLLAVVPQEAGGLPLAIQKRLADHQSDIDTQMKKIKSLKGLQDATFEFDAVPIYTAKNDFWVEAPATYLDSLHSQLEKNWKDDMIQEAILEEWVAPHKIRLIAEVDIKGEFENKKKSVSDSYNGLRLHQTLDILVGKEKWGNNTHNIYSHDLSTIL